MALFGGLVRLGIAAGAVYAAMKIADKYKENNPDGVSDTNEKITQIKRAAKEVYGETAEAVKEKTPEVKERFNATVQQVTDFASEKAPGVTSAFQNVVDKINEKTPEVKEKINETVQQVTDFASEKVPEVTAAFQNVVDKFNEKSPEVNEKFHEVVEKVSEKVISFADAVKEDAQESAESEFEDVVDAEVTSIEENKEEEPKE